MSNYFGSGEEAMQIVKAIGLRDKRIRDLERVLFRLHSNAAESEDWIRREIETVLKVEYGFQKKNVAGHIVEPPNRDEWVNWGKNVTVVEDEADE